MSALFLRDSAGAWVYRPAAQASAVDADAFGRDGRLTSFTRGGLAGSALLVRSGAVAFVNGVPVLGGLQVLEHRDELLVAGVRAFYSVESKVEPTTYQVADGRVVKCVLCRTPFVSGQDTIVKCPQCGRCYHHMEADADRPAKLCWTFRETCLCGHPTRLSDEPLWRPDVED